MYEGSEWYEFGHAPTGNWGHVAVVWDGKTLIGYDDGAPYKLASSGGASSTGKINIGKNPDPGGDELAGKVDEARIYDRALSESEIQSLAAMGGNSGGNGRGRGP